MRFIYNLAILFYKLAAQIIAPFNKKARLWVRGRRRWQETLAGKIIPGEKYIWIHCASLGEFEQGRPVIESLKKEKPELRILLTFFSPSGYELRKNYQMADIISYLPVDTPGNARKFISLVRPVKVFFVKYEFWYNFISEASKDKIPVYLISGIFRKDQLFFQWYGGFFRQILTKFTRIFVQNKESFDLLDSIGIRNVVIAGDTRFDRVAEIASQAKQIPRIKDFRGEGKLFIAGSSWRPDEEIIARYINSHPGKARWIFAPHEIGEENISRLEKLFPGKCVRFSGSQNDFTGSKVMIIDNIGMLSSAYQYAAIAAVGGGFGKGIHNILEPACWNIPVVFGPNHLKFREALDMIALGAAKSFSSYEEFEAIIDEWTSDETVYAKASALAGGYVNKNRGATALIMSEIV